VFQVVSRELVTDARPGSLIFQTENPPSTSVVFGVQLPPATGSMVTYPTPEIFVTALPPVVKHRKSCCSPPSVLLPGGSNVMTEGASEDIPAIVAVLVPQGASVLNRYWLGRVLTVPCETT